MSAFVRQHTRGERQRHDLSTDADAALPSVELIRQSAKPIKRESRLTFGGVVYVAVTVFLALGAINSQNNLLFWLFGVSIATLIVSGLFSGNALMNIRLEAQAITDSFASDSISIRYMVSNHSKFFPLFAAMISELPSETHPPGMFTPASILHLGPKDQIKVSGSLVPTQRGRYSVKRIRLSTRFPFGLLQKSLIFECHRTLMVMPYQLRVKPELVRIVQGHGEEVRKRTLTSGMSNEYWGLREYSPGDPKRSIAWKQSARQGKLVVVEHAQPIATKLWIWIPAECLDPGIDPIDSERAIALGASLISQASRRSVPVGLWVPSHGIRHMPSTGRASLMRCLRSLGMLELTNATARDAPPPSSNADDVLAITTQHAPRPPTGNIRVLGVDDPALWLSDPSTLPPALGAQGGGG